MSFGVFIVLSQILNGSLDFFSRHFLLLCTAVRKQNNLLAHKAGKYPVIYISSSCPQFVNSVRQIITIRPAKLISKIGKPANNSAALIFCPIRQTVQLVQQWHRSICILIYSYIRFRHPYLLYKISHICDISSSKKSKF